MWSFALQLYSRRLFIYMPQMWEDYKKMEIRKNIEQCKYYTHSITLEKCKNPEKESMIGIAFGWKCPFRQFCKFYEAKQK